MILSSTARFCILQHATWLNPLKQDLCKSPKIAVQHTANYRMIHTTSIPGSKTFKGLLWVMGSYMKTLFSAKVGTVGYFPLQICGWGLVGKRCTSTYQSGFSRIWFRIWWQFVDCLVTVKSDETKPTQLWWNRLTMFLSNKLIINNTWKWFLLILSWISVLKAICLEKACFPRCYCLKHAWFATSVSPIKNLTYNLISVSLLFF